MTLWHYNVCHVSCACSLFQLLFWFVCLAGLFVVAFVVVVCFWIRLYRYGPSVCHFIFNAVPGLLFRCCCCCYLSLILLLGLARCSLSQYLFITFFSFSYLHRQLIQSLTVVHWSDSSFPFLSFVFYFYYIFLT